MGIETVIEITNSAILTVVIAFLIGATVANITKTR